jgi:lysine-specific demethylase 8
MDTWPALKNWQQVEYWRRHAGPRTVPVEIGKNYMVEGWRQQLMLFSEFLDKHLVSSTSRVDVSSGKNPSECVYLAQHDLMAQIPHLAADVHQPEYCSLGQPVHATNTWMGPCGTVTPLHTDPEQNLLCQVVGRKYIRLYSPEHSRALLGSGGGGSNDSLTMNTSAVDVDTHPLIIDTPDGDEVGGQEAEEENEVGETANKSVHTDATRGEGREIESVEFPLYASTPFLDCILESGEMLYIPAGWWHYVKSLSTSASVNFWWRR